MEMNMELATEMVRVVQNLYLRGELSEEKIADVLEICPNATRDWDKLKLNMQVRRAKLLKRAVDVLKAALRKAKGCKRYRPGKEWTTNAKENSKLHKIERQFYRNGLHVLETWLEFMDAVAVQAGWGGCSAQ